MQEVLNDCQVILANYPEGTTEAEVRQLVSRYRPLNIIPGLNSLEDAGEGDFTYSYIIFPDHDTAEMAIEELDGRPFRTSEQIVLEYA